MLCLLQRSLLFPIRSHISGVFSRNQGKFQFLIARLCSSYETFEDEHEAHYSSMVRSLYQAGGFGHQVLIIQPRIKWGSQRKSTTTADLMLAEAIALVESLPQWRVVETLIVPVPYNLERKQIFGAGKMMALTEKIRNDRRLTAVFLNVQMMTGPQHTELSIAWNIPIYDRYNLVLHIFKMYAKTKEAKLQIALAEIPYLRSRLRGVTIKELSSQDVLGVAQAGGSGDRLYDTRRRLLQDREANLKRKLEQIRADRLRLRNEHKRKKAMPIVAVIGYTNAGKTSLIKCLTADAALVPEGRLFATLDVTYHPGLLPSRLTALYTDTVGFISDLPTKLIASFSATLDDIQSADLLIHVRDISHPDEVAQRENVLKTLVALQLPKEMLDGMIEVCNKVDLLDDEEVKELQLPESSILVSCKDKFGLEELVKRIDDSIIKQGVFIKRRFKIPIDGCELQFLYKESAVSQVTTSEDAKHLFVDVFITAEANKKFLLMHGEYEVDAGR